VNAQPPRVPLFRIMVGNASVLSVVYLLIGVALELLRRVYPAGWVQRAGLVLDSLAARTLELLGLMEPLRNAYVYGKISEFGLRLVFSATTIVLIFGMAVVVGAGMWIIQWLISRRHADA
jgi:hypothetical protein